MRATVLATPATASEPEAPLTVTTAALVFDGRPPRTVALPRTRPLDGPPASGSGRDRFDFALDEVPRNPWALGAARLSSRHAIRLNGVLVRGSLTSVSDHRGVPVPTLIDLPPALLRAGGRSGAVVKTFALAAR